MPFYVDVQPIPHKLRCFHCLHVRLGTLILAMLQLALHFIVILAMTTTLVGMKHPDSPPIVLDAKYNGVGVMTFVQWEWLVNACHSFIFSNTTTNNVPVLNESQPVVGVDVSNNSRYLGWTEKLFWVFHRNEHFDSGGSADIFTNDTQDYPEPKPYQGSASFFFNAGQEYVPVAVALFSLLCTLIMLVGAFYCRPYYLLPYNCMQIFDMVITSMSVTDYCTYLVKNSNHVTTGKMPFVIFIAVFGYLLLIFKLYIFQMISLCCKFLIKIIDGRECSNGFAIVASSTGTGSACPVVFARFGHCLGVRLNNPPPPRTAAYDNSRRRAGDMLTRLERVYPSRVDSDRRRVLTWLHEFVSGGSAPPNYDTATRYPTTAELPPPKYDDIVLTTPATTMTTSHQSPPPEVVLEPSSSSSIISEPPPPPYSSPSPPSTSAPYTMSEEDTRTPPHQV